jgi:hypothetical protein
VRETSATLSQHNKPRDAGFRATAWEPELRSDKQGTKAKTWFGIVRNNREHLI